MPEVGDSVGVSVGDIVGNESVEAKEQCKGEKEGPEAEEIQYMNINMCVCSCMYLQLLARRKDRSEGRNDQMEGTIKSKERQEGRKKGRKKGPEKRK